MWWENWKCLTDMLPAWEDYSHGHTHFQCVNSTTTLCQWNNYSPPLNLEIGWKIQGGLKFVRMISSLHTHSKLKSTAQHYLLVLSKLTWFGEEIALPNPDQWTELSLTWPGTWSEAGMAGQRSQPWDVHLTQYLLSTLAAVASVISAQTHTQNQAHCTHQDSNTPVMFHGTLMLIDGCSLDFFCSGRLPLTENTLRF